MPLPLFLSLSHLERCIGIVCVFVCALLTERWKSANFATTCSVLFHSKHFEPCLQLHTFLCMNMSAWHQRTSNMWIEHLITRVFIVAVEQYNTDKSFTEKPNENLWKRLYIRQRKKLTLCEIFFMFETIAIAVASLLHFEYFAKKRARISAGVCAFWAQPCFWRIHENAVCIRFLVWTLMKKSKQ